EIGRSRDPTGARAHHADVVSRGDLSHCVDRLVERSYVGVEPPVALLGSRIAPTDTEGLNATIQEKLHHAFVGRQIHCVVFVDLRRGDVPWSLARPGGRPCVLAELSPGLSPNPTVLGGAA